MKMISKIHQWHQNEDNIKNEEDIKNLENIKTKDVVENEDNKKMKMT